MVRIPDEYQEVEYLESTGTQYIDTGVYIAKSQVNYRVAVDSIFVSINTNQSNILFGNGFNAGSWFGASTDGQLTLGGGIYFTESPFTRSIKTAVFDGTKITATVGDETLSRTGSVGGNLHLLEYGNMYNSRARIYSEEVYDSNVLVQHLIPCYRKSDNKPGMYDTVSGTFYVNQGTGEFLVGNNVYYDTTNLLESRRRILMTTPHLESPTPANPLVFKSNMTAKLKEGKVYFTPVQEGTGDPSPDNVRPIHGWDGITVTKCGKNLLDASKRINGKYLNDSGVETSNSAVGYVDSFVPVYSGEQYTVSGNLGGSPSWNAAIYHFDENKQFIRREVFRSNLVPHTFMIPNDTKYIKVQYSCYNDAPNGGQLELGSTATDYEPYTATTLTIPFPKTIYGGYVDLVNGEVVEEYQKLVVDGTQTLKAGGKPNGDGVTSRYVTIANTGVSTSDLAGYSSVTKPINYTVWWAPSSKHAWTHVVIKTQIHIVFSNEVVGILTDDTYEQRNEKIKAWLTENPIDFCVPLATPIRYAIDPQVIRPLKGVNNIYSDANGNIEIKFWKH